MFMSWKYVHAGDKIYDVAPFFFLLRAKLYDLEVVRCIYTGLLSGYKSFVKLRGENLHR